MLGDWLRRILNLVQSMAGGEALPFLSIQATHGRDCAECATLGDGSRKLGETFAERPRRVRGWL